MSPSDRANPAWDAAWDWVIREHEQSLDPAAHAELIAWLKADPTHLEMYDRAHRVWLAAGLVPSSEPLDSDEPPVTPED